MLIKDALSCGTEPKELILRDGSEEALEFIESISLSDDCDKYVLDAELFENLSQTEHGRSIIAVFPIKSHSMDDWEEGDLVVLDRLQDPGNLGTIIRTADAAGVSGIIAMKGTVDPFSPKVVRAAAGSLFRVSIVEVEDVQSLKEILDRLEIDAIALDPRGAVDLYEMPDLDRIALIVGNEGAGICSEMLDIAEINIKIPMRKGIESLNAAMAFGIVIYERVRRRCRRS